MDTHVQLLLDEPWLYNYITLGYEHQKTISS